MSNSGKCQICGSKIKIYDYDIRNDRQAFDCSHCGRFYFLYSFEPDILNEQKNDFYKVSSWIYEQNNEFNNVPEIDEEKFIAVMKMPDKKIKEKFDFMMKYLANISLKKTDINYIKVACWMKDDDEQGALLTKAIDMGYVSGIEVQGSAAGTYIISINNPKLSFDGLEYVESLNEPNINSKQVFAAFYFSDEIKEIFDTEVRKAVEECGLTYTRVSSSTTAHDTTINDEIIAMIKSSRIVIADFTDHRNSVYFEAGYALGMKLPLIWTCRSDHADNLSFDTRQYPHILWDTADDLQQQLINRIKTIL